MFRRIVHVANDDGLNGWYGYGRLSLLPFLSGLFDLVAELDVLLLFNLLLLYVPKIYLLFH